MLCGGLFTKRHFLTSERRTAHRKAARLVGAAFSSSEGSMDVARYDAIVIGAGQAGVPLSQALAAAGMRTALVERAHVGGTCVNEGCTPTKTMVESARVAYLARRGADYGVRTSEISIDLKR